MLSNEYTLASSILPSFTALCFFGQPAALLKTSGARGLAACLPHVATAKFFPVLCFGEKGVLVFTLPAPLLPPQS
jgi:hypothetical protein